MNLKSLVAVFASLLLATLCTAQNLVTNGDFEANTTNYGTPPSGWTGTGAYAGVGSTVFSTTNSTNAALFSNHTLDSISQNLATTANATYNLSFDFGAFDSDQPQLVVSWNGSVIYSNPAVAGANYTTMTFNGLVATSSLTTLSFASSEFTSAGLDNVSVTAVAVPEPATYAALFGGLSLGYVMIRRRKVQASAK